MKELLFILLFPFGLFSQTVELVNESMSECNESIEPELILNHIQSKEIINDILYLSVGHKENCCFKPETTINFRNDTLFVSQENISRMWCGCECCFSQNFVITGVEDTCFTLIYNDITLEHSSNDRALFPDEYSLDFSQINKLNSSGKKNGLWVKKREKRNYLMLFHHGKFMWGISYSKNGKRETTTVSTGFALDEYTLLKVFERLQIMRNSELENIDFTQFKTSE